MHKNMYDVKKRRKPKKKDGFHIMQNIVRAVDERYHIDNTFYELDVENYVKYFKQCEELGFIVRAKGNSYCAEEFNITPQGHKFHKKSIGKITIEQNFKYGIGSTKIVVEKEI